MTHRFIFNLEGEANDISTPRGMYLQKLNQLTGFELVDLFDSTPGLGDLTPNLDASELYREGIPSTDPNNLQNVSPEEKIIRWQSMSCWYIGLVSEGTVEKIEEMSSEFGIDSWRYQGLSLCCSETTESSKSVHIMNSSDESLLFVSCPVPLYDVIAKTWAEIRTDKDKEYLDWHKSEGLDLGGYFDPEKGLWDYKILGCEHCCDDKLIQRLLKNVNTRFDAAWHLRLDAQLDWYGDNQHPERFSARIVKKELLQPYKPKD